MHQNEEKIKINVRRIPGSFLCEVTLYTEAGKGNIRVINIHKDAEATSTLYDVHGAQEIPPTFTVPEPIMRSMTQAFIDLAKQENITLEGTESYAKGKLEGTEKHLADMQSILKEVLPAVLNKN